MGLSNRIAEKFFKSVINLQTHPQMPVATNIIDRHRDGRLLKKFSKGLVMQIGIA
jgi:hypothetical protein